MSAGPSDVAHVLPTILVYIARDRSRSAVRNAFPRRKWRLITARAAEDFSATFKRSLVDAVLIDLGAPTEDVWEMAALARDYPSTPFFALVPMRASDAPAVARIATLEFVDVLADGMDDAVMRDLVQPHTFSNRFEVALMEPPASLSLVSEMQRATWRAMLPYAGRPIRTGDLALRVGVSREHLSRNFAMGGAPNLKRVIDLVRLIGAAELAKNPGHDIRDVACILGFASSSHLAVTAGRVLGTRPASLARLRTIDLVDRFTQGRTRSRGSLP